MIGPADIEPEGISGSEDSDLEDMEADVQEYEPPEYKPAFFKRVWTRIKGTLAGETGVGKAGSVLKDIILPFVPSGGIINRITDKTATLFKSQSNSKPMLSKILSLKNFINVRDENGNISGQEILASVLQIVIAGAIVWGATELGIWSQLSDFWDYK